jgi:excisionase family DNA binding protein
MTKSDITTGKEIRRMDTVLTAAEVAQLLRIHLSTVYRLIKNNGLPGIRVGSDWRFSQEAIEKWMKAQR